MTAFPKPQPREKRPRRPLKRHTWMARRRPRRLSRAGSDPAYLAWLHAQPCHLDAGYMYHEHCEGRIEAAHLRDMTGLGLKEPDRNAIPLCSLAHRMFDQHKGIFLGWSKLERFAWFMGAIAVTQARYAGVTRAALG